MSAQDERPFVHCVISQVYLSGWFIVTVQLRLITADTDSQTWFEFSAFPASFNCEGLMLYTYTQQLVQTSW